MDHSTGFPGREDVTDADRLFGALADGTRRSAVKALLQAPRTSGDLARTLGVTPQALTRHLRVLRRSGLVQAEGDEADARLRIYRVAPEAFAPLRTWLDDAERMWSIQLAAFAHFAEDGTRK